jgi:hypothetical protein
MTLRARTHQEMDDPTAVAHTLETTFLERLKNRAYWQPDVRQALEMLEIAEDNQGFEHVCVKPKAA